MPKGSLSFFHFLDVFLYAKNEKDSTQKNPTWLDENILGQNSTSRFLPDMHGVYTKESSPPLWLSLRSSQANINDILLKNTVEISTWSYFGSLLPNTGWNRIFLNNLAHASNTSSSCPKNLSSWLEFTCPLNMLKKQAPEKTLGAHRARYRARWSC